MTALLHRRQLVFVVHPGGTGGDHVLHEFESIEHATETGLGVGHDWQEVIDITVIARPNVARPLDLVGTFEGVIDAAHHGRH